MFDPHLSGFVRLTHVPFLLRTLQPPFDVLSVVRADPRTSTHCKGACALLVVRRWSFCCCACAWLPAASHSPPATPHRSFPAQPSAARERRHVHLRVTGGTLASFGDVLAALLAAMFDVDKGELPPQVAARAARAVDGQRRRLASMFAAKAGKSTGRRALATRVTDSCWCP